MVNKFLLYVIAGLVLLCVGLGITVAVEEVRIARLKTELNTAILERDSLKALSASQNENLTNLNILLGDAEAACRKRLNARASVDTIFNKEKRSPTCAGETHPLISEAERVPISSSGVSAPLLNSKPVATLPQNIKVSHEIISLDESIAAIRHINGSFGVQWQNDSL